MAVVGFFGNASQDAKSDTKEASMTDLAHLTASALTAALEARATTAEAIALACLDRIAARDADVCAWAYLDREQVLAEARRLDSEPRRSKLHGIPIGIKDVILTADMPTGQNSPIHAGHQPHLDAACVTVLRAAGALIFGKTVTTEFAASTRGGATRNPFDPAYSPGGSSSGSAAAVADFQIPLAVGTQTGGSIIRPGSFCGIPALKPSWSAISREGLKSVSPSCDTIGFFARSIDDLELVAQTFGVADDATQRLFALKGMRIATYRSPSWEKAEPATRNAFARGVGLLADAGTEIVEIELPPAFERLVAHHIAISFSEGATSFLGEYMSTPDLLGPQIRSMVENQSSTSKSDVLHAHDEAAQCRLAFDKAMIGVDALLTPSAVGEAPYGLEWTGDSAFNGIWTLLGVPVVNLPGFAGPAGMPVGLSLVSPRSTDRRLLVAARHIAPLFVAGGGWRDTAKSCAHH
jgi:Asp-tRNA(Asn)/Glu-tRNA(Gln) amidotransferase A subunit family amidase